MWRLGPTKRPLLQAVLATYIVAAEPVVGGEHGVCPQSDAITVPKEPVLSSSNGRSYSCVKLNEAELAVLAQGAIAQTNTVARGLSVAWLICNEILQAW